MKRVCLCEICNCGRHRCPHQPTALHKKGSMVGAMSEYTQKYPFYEGYLPPKSLKPQYEYNDNKGKMESSTTFQSDFLPYEVTRRLAKQKAEYQPSPGQIDLDTTYKQNFNPYKLQPVAPLRPKVRLRGNSGKMDTVPTYKDDFRQWELEKRALSKPEELYHPPAAKFGNTTTFQDDFVRRDPVARQSFKPPNVAKLSDVPFEGVTSNQLSYLPYQVEPRFVKPPEKYVPSSQPFQDLTTHRKDFQGLSGQLPKSCKPDQANVTSDAPFQTSTEFRDRFQQWPVSLPARQKLEEYSSPTTGMDLTTTTQTTYVKYNVQPSMPIKPFSRMTRSSAPFQGNTTMREDFKAWAARRQDPIHKPEEIQRATGKMEDLTTFKAHFVQHPLRPNVSYKPVAAPLKTNIPLEDDTMYRTEFVPKRISLCPASFQTPPGFMFEDSDERGHRFFRKMSTHDKMGASFDVLEPMAMAVRSVEQEKVF